MEPISALKGIAEQLMAGGGVIFEGQALAVKRLHGGKLRTVRFHLDGRELQAIEQNPEKPSQWGKLARQGHQVVQFKDVDTNRYLAVAVDGNVKTYKR